MSSQVSKYHLPLPAICHMTLDDSLIGDRAILVIGDVHGCKDELVELLKLAKEEERDRDILPIFVGDLLNKGPKSIETMELLRTMDHFAVRGNHEEAVLNQLQNAEEDENYELPAKYDWIKNLTEEDIEYHKNLPYTISIPSLNAIIVHAGLVPGIPIEQQNYTNMICMRNLVPREDGMGYIGREVRDKGEPWASLWPGPQHVYFGHDAVRQFQDYPYATGLDTGCLYGYSLTAIFLNGCKRKIEVRAKKVYRPP
ncbi:hypothetical protein FSP39_025372 [Pinctada imbricata]|uniref:Calcineurin-like phosphoesterase domain-containing protein n=1 Tax=Pinctada imbricata TaxID=66713 RepID=A0AA89C258_PINIB|nr:hypothetical protein FSP39_025372 [Pinctada imbricata]